MKREELDVNTLVYSTDIDTMLIDCEGTEVWPQDNNGNEYYYKSQADKVMDAMEARIKELEAVISNESKWIPVYRGLPAYGKTVRVRTINSNREVKEGTATFHDGGDWGKDYWTKHGDTVGRITHWMP